MDDYDFKSIEDYKIGDRHRFPVGDIIFKSPVEHDVQFLYGDPYIYITSDRNHKLYYWWDLDTENKEYVLTEIGDNFSEMHEAAVKKNFEIARELNAKRRRVWEN